MLAAMCAVLGAAATINIGTFMKISLVSLPVLIGGIVFGAVDGALIGGVGTFIYQLVAYGLEWSTVLWLLPYIAAGLIAGLMSKKWGYNPNQKQMILINIVVAIAITLVNTLSLIIYYQVLKIDKAILFTSLPSKILTAVIRAVLFAFIIPPLAKAIKKVVR